ncbi:MAG: Holliday junction branch migration protein RuvA [Rickettsiales bacterium]|jgi:Holliday junction DNA helicase RuvA|nr:Holliday junction branch migration protein RuvA [Rickettsiales bacterium]
MIGKIQGIIDTITDNSAIVMAGGVGYLVFMDTGTLSKLKKGEAATLWIETNVREDAINLYGFASSDDKNMFNMLTQVQGIGPKAAMSILGTLPVPTIIRAVIAGDKAAFTAAPGVGPKVAERITTELKSQIKKLSAAAGAELEAGAGNNSAAFADAVSALEGLGYKRASAIPAVREILDAGPDLPLDQIIMKALKVL